MTWATLLLQAEPLSANSAISVGLMITILGAAIFLSRSLTRTEEQLKQINTKLNDLAKLPERVTLLENHMSNLEMDVNNLWVAYRSGDAREALDLTRRERGPLRPKHPNQERDQ